MPNNQVIFTVPSGSRLALLKLLFSNLRHG
jgi:hypothetical protein